MEKISDVALDLGLFALDSESEDPIVEQQRVPLQAVPQKFAAAEIRQIGSSFGGRHPAQGWDR